MGSARERDLDTSQSLEPESRVTFWVRGGRLVLRRGAFVTNSPLWDDRHVMRRDADACGTTSTSSLSADADRLVPTDKANNADPVPGPDSVAAGLLIQA